ncbi:MAG: 4Fe-4S dicluster domain-containing protein [Gemmatimonadota bacterium]|nr:MAG: 4Fe-4S dicluster domain-containing protein [Gemmatimonadota bacterium]
MRSLVAHIEINQAWCKGCQICVEICSRGVLGYATDVSDKGFRPIIVEKIEDCTGCIMCELMCPDLAITVEKVEK